MGKFSKLVWAIAILCCAYASAAALGQAQTPEPWMQQVNQVIGTQGKLSPDGVLSWNLIRRDFSFQIQLNGSSNQGNDDRDDDGDKHHKDKKGKDSGSKASGSGYSLLPAMASGEIAFKSQSTGQVLMTLEFELHEAEVNTFVSALEARGIRVTAIHNHYILEQPKIIYVHADALGNPVRLAQAAKAAWNAVNANVDADGESDSDDTVSGLDPEQLGNIIGGMADPLDGIVDVTVPRKETVTDQFDGYMAEMPPEMGPQSDFEFQPLGHGQAFVVGEFCLRPGEVNPVIRVLRNAGITVSALHNHFLEEQPRLFFLHIEAAGDATQLAHTIRQALNLTNSQFR